MTLDVEPRTEWTATGAAYGGAVLGAVAVMVHELYTGISGCCPEVDPFTHVLAELAIFAPGGAVMLGIAANVHNGLVRRKHSALLLQDNLDKPQGLETPEAKWHTALQTLPAGSP
jgi:hypothetical protein